MTRNVGLGALLFLIATTPALAYIDPVTTSIVLQAVIGGFAAFLVAVRRVRERIFGFFRRKPAEAETKAQDQDL